MDKKALDIANAAYTGKAPPGFKKIRDLSDRRSKVFVDEKSGDVHIGFRGTEPSRFNDLIADGHILLGTQRYPSRFNEAQEKLKRTQKLFPDRKV